MSQWQLPIPPWWKMEFSVSKKEGFTQSSSTNILIFQIQVLPSWSAPLVSLGTLLIKLNVAQSTQRAYRVEISDHWLIVVNLCNPERLNIFKWCRNFKNSQKVKFPTHGLLRWMLSQVWKRLSGLFVSMKWIH